MEALLAEPFGRSREGRLVDRLGRKPEVERRAWRALHTIERITRIDPNILDYQITIEDPKMFTRPIKIAGTFQAAAAGTELMEFACAEGSQVLPNVFGFELAPGRAPAGR